MTNNTNIDVENKLLSIMRHMQAVNECKEELNNLQSVWDYLSLLGQLSGTGSDINGTRQSFQKLTESLMHQLANETLKKCALEMISKAQVTIDILVRNLFERTADIGFLATDDDICAVLKQANKLKGKYSKKQDMEISLHRLRDRFSEYLAKYSVYSDIVLLDVEGDILLRFKDCPDVERTHHQLLQLSLASTEAYVETFDKIDFLPDEDCSLVYSYRVIDSENKTLGVLCLCFRFNNEMKGIFANLVADEDWSVITLLNSDGRVIASSDIYHVPLGACLALGVDSEYRVQRFRGQEYLTSTRCSSGYQGYAGPHWYAHVMLPLQQAFNQDASGLLKNIPVETLETIMAHSQLFGDSLRSIPQQADRIQTELNRSVWNGNIRQSRFGQRKDTGFSKILLWEISNTGARTQSVFQRSIANLHETVVSSVLQGSHFQASLAIQIMDRNLYERANDCRWWALTSLFRELLAEAHIAALDQHRIATILSYINSLYTVYTNLMVFDARGQIIAVSNTHDAELVGQFVGEEWHRRVLVLANSQGYAVSDFVDTRFYNGRPTYIYGAAIREHTGSKIIGGIGIVFDAEPQFSAMLRDALPKNAEGHIDTTSFGVFVTREGCVLACSDDKFTAGDKLPIPSTFCALAPGEETTGIISMKGYYYAIGAHASSGYREYKNEGDSYKNEVIAIVGKQLCVITEQQQDKNELSCPVISSDLGLAGLTVEIATFRLGNEWFGIRASQILEAIDATHITSAPGAGAECIGYLMYEKSPMPIFDIRSMVCANKSPTEFSNRKTQQVMVIEKNADTRFGLIADGLGEIPEIFESRLNTLPTVLGGSTLLADAAVAPDNADEQSLLLVLSCERLAQKLASGMKDEQSPSNTIRKAAELITTPL